MPSKAYRYTNHCGRMELQTSLHQRPCHVSYFCRQQQQLVPHHKQLLPKQHRLSLPALQAAAETAKASAKAAQSPVPMQRKAWHITQQGDINSLQLIEEQMPALSPAAAAPETALTAAQGQVLVEVQAWGLNFADVFCALGLYKAAPKGDFVPGLEFAGTVLEVLPDAAESPSSATETVQGQPKQHQSQQHSFKPGDRVLGVLRFGAFASHVALPAAYLRPVPKHWTLEQAASYPVQTLTAAYGLFEAGAFRRGQAVLVHSAAGGVGLQALQILSKSNAAVLGLVGSNSKVQMLQEKYNSSTVAATQQHMDPQQQQSQQQQQHSQPQRPYFEFAARQGDAAAAKQQLSDFLARSGCSGFDVILDSLGPGPYFQASYDALNPCGRHVIFGAGALTPKPGLRVSLNPLNLLTAPQSLWGLLKLGWAWLRRPKLDVLNMPGDNKGVVGFNLIWLYDRLDILADLYQQVDGLELDPPVVGRVFGFDQLKEALLYLQTGESVGKVVLSADPSTGD